MPEFRTSNEALRKCEINGQILPALEIDIDKIKALIEFSDGDQEAALKLMQGLDEKSILWNNAYIAYYDALHKLVDAYLRFDKITSLNHLCLFSYLCEKHPELELDWNFFEKIRTKRNGVQYYGQKASKEDWTLIQLQMKLYIRVLEKAIEKKLKEPSGF